MIDDAIVMDKKTFKLLASDTKVKILKLLQTRDHNLSEISRKLNLSKSTVKEHIDKLISAEIVKEVDRGKWKYYTLTKYGKKLIGNKEDNNVNVKRVVIILGLFLLGTLTLFILTDIFFRLNDSYYGLKGVEGLGSTEKKEVFGKAYEGEPITPGQSQEYTSKPSQYTKDKTENIPVMNLPENMRTEHQELNTTKDIQINKTNKNESFESSQ